MSASSDTVRNVIGAGHVLVAAVDILMVEHNISEDAAIELLVRTSTESALTVREVATLIVADAHARTYPLDDAELFVGGVQRVSVRGRRNHPV